MELTERYLQAVRSYLTGADQHDIVAELKDSLLSRIEEREATLGRALNEAELAQMLKDFGHPLMVASRYLPQQHLIGPTFFPFWWLTMRAMLIIVAIVHGVLGALTLIDHPNSTRVVIQSIYEAAGSALFWSGLITALFWLFEHHQLRFGLLNNWQPDKLASVSKQQLIKRSSSIFELIFTGVFLLWWTGWQPLPQTIYHHGQVLSFGLTSIWQSYFWPILLLLSADMLLSALNLWHPYWTRVRVQVRLTLNLIALVVTVLLLNNDLPLVHLIGSETVTEMVKFEYSLNKSMQVVLGIVAIVNFYEIFDGGLRLWRMQRA